ncbi:hypothetical protein Afil01_62690 [Actinorhabdospora filicis]|uniref:DUF4383 domain-containing protein n=1 Tax=Actinorhabdospora filicis TaxID=1785913 RepID=A0A9W6SSG7_9ACTN|nr:DUF4383 domain-containing protein [Actinorhabdospora filicis]GLZ81462.1 hypothetical protein Afil01_62690 [Actinorhabdospora filicis]
MNARSPNRIVGAIFGAVFTLVGLIGFFWSGGHAAMGHEGGAILGLFEVNVAHNIVHLAVGAALLAGSVLGTPAARAANGTVGAVYLAVGVAGLFLIGTDLNILALNGADNALHLVVGAVLLGTALGLDRRSAGVHHDQRKSHA